MKVSKEDSRFPVLLSFPVGDKQVAVWCPFCIQWHYHGLAEGHRAGHCVNPKSPLKVTGYIVRAGTTKDYVFKNGNCKNANGYPTDPHY